MKALLKFYMNSEIAKVDKKAPTLIRTASAAFKVPSVNHYTIGACPGRDSNPRTFR